MFSSNLKRSVATLGVVAGLLAAAVPATALGSAGLTAQTPNDGVKAPTNAWPSKIEITSVKAAEPSGTSPPFVPDARNISIATAEVFELNTFGGNDSLHARGTQVGSEGVKGNNGAPGREPLSGYSFGASQTGTSNYSWGASQTGTMGITKHYDMSSPY